jgi:hypothetical protein
MENRRKGISAILFDLDNTLIATRKADKQTCTKVSPSAAVAFSLRGSFPVAKREFRGNVPISCSRRCDACARRHGGCLVNRSTWSSVQESTTGIN